MTALFGVLIIATALIVFACEGDEPEPGVAQAEPEEKSDEVDPEEADAKDETREDQRKGQLKKLLRMIVKACD